MMLIPHPHFLFDISPARAVHILCIGSSVRESMKCLSTKLQEYTCDWCQARRERRSHFSEKAAFCTRHECVGDRELAPPHVEIEWNIDGPCVRARKQHAVKPRQQRARASIGATGIVGHAMALQEGSHNRRTRVYR